VNGISIGFNAWQDPGPRPRANQKCIGLNDLSIHIQTMRVEKPSPADHPSDSMVSKAFLNLFPPPSHEATFESHQIPDVRRGGKVTV
jgi:hypothetical protein